MEWIETTAKSVEDAKELALDKLGVDETEAEFEVVEEPRQGLFGRTRGQARVRTRVVPKAPRAKDDRRDRKRKPRGKGGPRGQSSKAPASKGEGESSQQQEKPTNNRQRGGKKNSRDGGRSGGPGDGQNRRERTKVEDSPMEDVTACVDEFLTGLTAAFGIETTVDIEVEDENIMAKIEGKHGLLLGPKARTLDAIQELTRVTAQRATPSGARIKVDVGGYREARKVALAGFAAKAAERAIAEQVEVVLEAMTSADRKVVHDALTDVQGVQTRSAGNDPNRRVVVVPEFVEDVDEDDTDDEGPEDSADS